MSDIAALLPYEKAERLLSDGGWNGVTWLRNRVAGVGAYMIGATEIANRKWEQAYLSFALGQDLRGWVALPFRLRKVALDRKLHLLTNLPDDVRECVAFHAYWELVETEGVADRKDNSASSPLFIDIEKLHKFALCLSRYVINENVKKLAEDSRGEARKRLELSGESSYEDHL